MTIRPWSIGPPRLPGVARGGQHALVLWSAHSPGEYKVVVVGTDGKSMAVKRTMTRESAKVAFDEKPLLAGVRL